jgi:sulfur carrier protein
MPIFTVNGQPQSESAVTIPDLLRARGVPQDQWNSIAIAVNGEVANRTHWGALMLSEGDRIDIVKPMAGG